MRQATLCFLLKDNQILLAMKKRAFGQGKWNGVGGKPNPNENIKDTAIRETEEEIKVTPKNIELMAVLDFHFKYKPEWDQQVLAYITTEWEGDPTETEEMKPQWFDLDKIPYNSMWTSDTLWLPLILKNKKVKGKVIFGENETIISKKVYEIQHF